MGVLAAFGARAIQDGLSSRRPPWAAAVLPGILLLLLFIEYGNTGMVFMDMPHSFGTVYKVMHSAGPGVLVELPMPTSGTMPGRDTDYEYWSTSHWHPLVNGYSGYYPPDYIETLARMQTFPDDESIARLRRLDVRYVIVHCRFYQTDKEDFCPPLLAKIGSRRDLHSYERSIRSGRCRVPLRLRPLAANGPRETRRQKQGRSRSRAPRLAGCV